jgi:exopolysaccharide biosynthesis polyprenyl glycosylphosphotransferase
MTAPHPLPSKETRAARRSSGLARRTRALVASLLLDALFINIAFALGYYVRYRLQLFIPVNVANFAPYSVYVPSSWLHLMLLIFLAFDGVYHRRRQGSWFDELYRIGNATTTVVVILIATTFISLLYSRLLLLEAGLITIALLSAYRLLWRALDANLRRRGVGIDRVLIVGADELGRAVMRNLVARPELGYRVVGLWMTTSARRPRPLQGPGRAESIGGIVKGERVDEVIITLPGPTTAPSWAVRSCESLGVRARVVPDVFQLSLNRVDMDDLGGIPLMGLKDTRLPRVAQVVKRAMDFVFAALALLLTSPLLALVAVLVRLDSPGPALFRQKRVGQGGRLFEIYKFRSMRVGAEAEQALLKDQNESSGPLFKMKADPRFTGLGRFLRRSSIDELPQFINVLRGEMSVVGPRPAALPRWPNTCPGTASAWRCRPASPACGRPPATRSSPSTMLPARHLLHRKLVARPST